MGPVVLSSQGIQSRVPVISAPHPRPGPLFISYLHPLANTLILNQLRLGWGCCRPHPPGRSCLAAQWNKRVPSLSFQGAGSEMAQGPNQGD